MLPLLIFCLLWTAFALENGLARTPPMGWLSWERFRCQTDCFLHPDTCISESLYLEMAQRLKSDGFKEAGYDTVTIDDCWAEKERNHQGKLTADARRFKHGIPWLADQIHGLGLKIGIYGDFGNKTCAGYPGTPLQYQEIDADTFASWGIDSLKLDGCNSRVETMDEGYPRMERKLNATGRPILFSCSWPDYLRIAKLPVNYTRVGEFCNLWRMYNDVQNSWKSVISIIDFCGDNQETLAPAAGPGRWNDPDMIIVGDSLSLQESRTQFSLWAIMAVPLFMSNDLRDLSDDARSVLLNADVINVNQDPLGSQGRRIVKDSDREVWTRPLSGGRTAVAFLNRFEFETGMTATLKELHLDGPVHIRDLWSNREWDANETIAVQSIKGHGVAMLEVN